MYNIIIEGLGRNPYHPYNHLIYMEKLMIFIDGENLFLASRDENIKVGFEKLIKFLSEGFNLIRVYYYTGVPTYRTWNKDKETEEEFKTSKT